MGTQNIDVKKALSTLKGTQADDPQYWEQLFDGIVDNGVVDAEVELKPLLEDQRFSLHAQRFFDTVFLSDSSLFNATRFTDFGISMKLASIITNYGTAQQRREALGGDTELAAMLAREKEANTAKAKVRYSFPKAADPWGDFKALAASNLKKALEKLIAHPSVKDPIVDDAYRQIKKNGYRLVLYRPQDTTLPKYVHRAMNPTNGFVGGSTDKNAKKIYLSLSGMEKIAQEIGVSPAVAMASTLVNEAVHAATERNYEPLSSMVAQLELELLAKGTLFTTDPPGLKMFKIYLLEQVVSEVASQVYWRRKKGENLTLNDVTVTKDNSFHARQVRTLKKAFLEDGMRDVYGFSLKGALDKLGETGSKPFLDFINSDEIEKELRAKLSQPPFSLR